MPAKSDISPILKVPRDPVCGIEVNPLHPQAQSEWQGRIFCFCCEECQRLFEHHPDRYALLNVESPRTRSTE